MLKFIMGEKGAGKTKSLLDLVNKAVDSEKGAVVFINNGNRHMYDLSHKIRLVDTGDFAISSLDVFYGVLCGIMSQNFDVSDLFIDSLTKIVDFSDEELEAFAEKTNALCDKFNLNMYITISRSTEGLSDKVKAYLA